MGFKLTGGSGGRGLPDYSTTEILYGRKWIDNRDVYEKTYILGSVLSPVVIDTFTPTTLIIEVSAVLKNYNSRFGYYYWVLEDVITFRDDTHELIFNASAEEAIVIVRYVK